MKLKVCKFGGSSLSNSSRFKKVKEIIKTDSSRRVIIVSAIGKRNELDIKITDKLIKLFDLINSNQDWIQTWNEIASRFLSIENELNINANISDELDTIKEKIIANSIDYAYLVSRGEYLTAKLMSKYLNFEFVDASDVIVFRENKLDTQLSSTRLNSFFTNKNIVIPGFYVSNSSKEIVLLSRGGSDVTGAIVSSILKADLYENWTDVSGVFNFNPTIIKEAYPIPFLSYSQLEKLSSSGTTVIHEDTIKYLTKSNIPLHIKNSLNPKDIGTMVSSKGNKNAIVGMSNMAVYRYSIKDVERANLCLESSNTIYLEHDHADMIVYAKSAIDDNSLYERFEMITILFNHLPPKFLHYLIQDTEIKSISIENEKGVCRLFVPKTNFKQVLNNIFQLTKFQ